MREIEHVDIDGRRWMMMIPDDAPDTAASMGVTLGPARLDALDLPLSVEVRLHNELFVRRLFTAGDVRQRRQEVFGALQSALQIETQRVVDVYEGQYTAAQEPNAETGGTA